MKWFIYVLKNTFNYKGRARRAEFGYFMLTNMLIQLAVLIILGIILIIFGVSAQMLGMNSGTLEASAIMGLIGIYIIYNIYQFIIWLASLSLVCRRLHDLGYSGWWQLILFYLIPIALGVSAALVSEEESGMELLLTDLLLIYSLGVMAICCVLLLKDGQRQTNKYGEDPKATDLAETES